MRLLAPVIASALLALAGSSAYPQTDRPAIEAALAALDARYQTAVERNDVATMNALLADDFVLVDGDGDAHSKAELIAEASSGKNRYTLQDDVERTVRLYDATAVITAKIRAKGSEGAEPVDYTLWFSSTWTHTPAGWRCVFVQTSEPVEN